MRRAFFAALIIFPALPLAAGAADYPTSQGSRFNSPSGRWQVAWDPIGTPPKTDPDVSNPLERVKNIRYRVSFYTPGTNTAVATTEYFDVFGSTAAPRATPVSQLAAGILWSPTEAFAILPKERDASSGKAGRKVLSLDLKSSWQEKPFPLADQPLIWTDPMHVFGQIMGDCGPAVGAFDGKTGTVEPIAQAEASAGYEIISHDSMTILCRKVLSACAGEADRKSFRPDCVRFNLSFMRREVVQCPRL